MATVEITRDNLAATIEQGGTVLLDFWAAWCGPCRAFGPIFEKASESHPEIVFGKIDTEDQRELASGFRISSIPTLMVFRDGVLVFSQPGALPGPALEELIEKVGELDMDEVRAEIARTEAELKQAHDAAASA